MVLGKVASFEYADFFLKRIFKIFIILILLIILLIN